MGAREEAQKLLVHYLGLAHSKPLTNDNVSEINTIVDYIIDAAAEELKPHVITAVERLMVELDKRDETLDRLIRAVEGLES